MRRALVAVLFITLSLGLLLSTAGQAQGTRAVILPASGVVAPGETVTMEIVVQDVRDLYGVDFGLSFNAAKLEAQNVTAGEFLAPVFEAQKTMDNRTGQVRYVFALMGPVPPVSGSGVLARVVFRGLQAGESVVTFERLLLANDAAEEIPATWSGAVIAVGSATTGTATTTMTVTPTSSRTPTPTRTSTTTTTATPTPTVTLTRTQVPTPTSPTPALEELVLQQAAAALGWGATIESQPPMYKIAHVVSAGHSAEAWIRRYERPGDAEVALQQERLGLVAAGWDVDALQFFGYDAYRASRSLQPQSLTLPQSERRFAFAAAFWVAGAHASDDSLQNLAPDPEAVAQALYQAGLSYGLFGPRYPRAFLPLVMRAFSTRPAGPTATASLPPTATVTPHATVTHLASPTATGFHTPTVTPSATATGMHTLTPSATPSPTVTQGPPPSPTVTPSATPLVTPLPTPLYEQLLVNPSFETDAGWTLQGGVAPGYSVSRAHKGLRSMRLGIVAPYSGGVYSSVRQDVAIPQGVAEAQLSFFFFPVSSPADSDYMYFIVRRVPDGQELDRAVWVNRKQAWNLWTYDLSAYAGQTVQLWIGVYNDGLGVTTVYLDDVELWVPAAD